MNLPSFIIPALENIYISPLELCNLNCKYCYTNKTKNILSNQQILDFISSYSVFLRSNTYDLKSVLFCGGEVFLLPDFTNLVNTLASQDIFVSIITNGTVDKLAEIKDPNNVQLLVSLDGPKEVHDKNRGAGNFDKTIAFINSALQKKFHVEIMFLVTQDSYPYIDSFSSTIYDLTSKKLDLNYITIKSRFYTDNHPLSRDNDNSLSLTPDQIINIKRRYPSLPAKNFGCFQLSLQSNGKLYGCCESPTPLGSLTDPIDTIVDNFIQSLNPCTKCHLSSLRSNSYDLQSQATCHGCTAPDFLCGYKKELQLLNCTDVVKRFNQQ